MQPSTETNTMESVDYFTKKDFDSPTYRKRDDGKISVTIFSKTKPIGPRLEEDQKEIYTPSNEDEMDIDAFHLRTLFKDTYEVPLEDIKIHHERKIEEAHKILKNVGKESGDKYDMFFFVFLTYLKYGEQEKQLQFHDGSTTLDKLIDVIKDNSTLHMKPKIFIVQADDLGKYKDPKVRAKGPTVLKPLKIPCDADRLVIMSTIPQFLANLPKKKRPDPEIEKLSLTDSKSVESDSESTNMEKNRSSLMIEAFVSVMSDQAYKDVDLLSRTPLINGKFQELVDDLELTGDYDGLEILIPLVTSTLTKLVMMQHSQS